MWDFTIKINTPENTEIEFELAGIGNRFAALLIDTMIITLITFIIAISSIILYFIFKDMFDIINSTIRAIIIIIMFVLWSNGYFILFEYFWSGQTPGKRLLGIRVIRENGQPVGFLEVFIRNVIRYIDILVGPYFILFSKREKRLGDFAIGTIVVKEKEVYVPIVDTDIPDDFKADIPNISKLTPKDFTLIGSFLKRKDNFEYSARDNLLDEFISYYYDKLSLGSVYNIEGIDELSYDEKLKWLIDIYNAYKVRGNISTNLGGAS